MNIFADIPHDVRPAFEQALRDQGFGYALADNFECAYGDPVLTFKLGFVLGMDAVEAAIYQPLPKVQCPQCGSKARRAREPKRVEEHWDVYDAMCIRGHAFEAAVAH
jgi:hypothetical protein